MGVLAVVGIRIVVAHNLPPPSPEEQARRAFADAVREPAAAVETERKQNCRRPVRRLRRPGRAKLQHSFDAHYDPTTGYHWTTFMVDYGSADFQWRKCMSGLGYSMD